MRFPKLRCVLTTAMASGLAVSSAGAQRATQVVRYSIIAVSQGNISGGEAEGGSTFRNPSGGSIGTPRSQEGGRSGAALALALGLGANRVMASTTWETTYALVSNEENKKLTVSIEDSLPGGIEVNAKLAAPNGAATKGAVKLGTTGSDMVTQIGPGRTPPLPAHLWISETEMAARERQRLRVTFTLISGA